MSDAFKSILMFVFAALTLFAGETAPAPAQLNDVSIIEMVQGKVAPDLIKLAIARCEPHFTFDSGSLVALQKAGVPDDIVKAMAARQYGQPIPGYELRPAATPSTAEPFYTTAPVEPASKQGPTTAGVMSIKSVSEDYGLQLGSVVGYGGGGFSFNSDFGTHPNYMGGITVGVYKYLGIFGAGGYGPLLHESVCDSGYCATATVNGFFGGAGIEAVVTNRSRFVPYGRFGLGYGQRSGSVSLSGAGTILNYNYNFGAPALMFGGGTRIYISRHFGASAEVLALRFVGNNGGFTYPAMTFGVFVQSK